jgi:hypothetical protein
VDFRAILRLEGFRSIEKSNDLIGNRTRHLPACSIVPQPTTLPHAPIYGCNAIYNLNKPFKPDYRGRVGKYSRRVGESEKSLEK